MLRMMKLRSLRRIDLDLMGNSLSACPPFAAKSGMLIVTAIPIEIVICTVETKFMEKASGSLEVPIPDLSELPGFHGIGASFRFGDTILARACGAPAVGVQAVDCWQ